MQDLAKGSKVAIVTGASSGIGGSVARKGGERGYRVYGRRRRDSNQVKLNALTTELPTGCVDERSSE